MTTYVIINERDCDNMSVTYRCKAKNMRLLEAKMDDVYKWAEGPVYVQRCTKAEYYSFKSHRRDLAAEQAGY